MIAEIVGVAGAGKTTISQELARRSSAIGESYTLPSREIIPSFLWHAARSLPSYLPGRPKERRLSLDSLMTMAYLERLEHTISRENTRRSRLFFFDQGPVYSLAYLGAFDFESARDRELDHWWQEMLLSWSSMMDAVFWVDAEDDVLLNRITSRQTWHRAKDMPELEAYEFLTRYRRTYERILDGMTSQSHTQLLKFHTDRDSVEQIVSRILDVLEPRQSLCVP